MAEWLRRLTRKPKVRTAVGSNPALDSLVAVRNSSPGRPEPCEGNLVAAAGSRGGLMVKHPWPLLEISLSDFRRLATLDMNTYLPTCKAPGPDKIPTMQIKVAEDLICKPLTMVFNSSLRKGIFPDVWKQARVTPIFISDSKSKANNYRPISVISVFSRIHE